MTSPGVLAPCVSSSSIPPRAWRRERPWELSGGGPVLGWDGPAERGEVSELMLKEDSSSPLHKDLETPGFPGRGGPRAKCQPRGGAPGTHSPKNPQGSGSVLCREEVTGPCAQPQFPLSSTFPRPLLSGLGGVVPDRAVAKTNHCQYGRREMGLRPLKFPPLPRFSLPNCKLGVQQMHPLARFHAAPRALPRAPWSRVLGSPAASAHRPPAPCAQLRPPALPRVRSRLDRAGAAEGSSRCRYRCCPHDAGGCAPRPLALSSPRFPV